VAAEGPSGGRRPHRKIEVVVIVGRQRPPWRPRAAPEDREVNHKGWGVGRQRRAEDPMAAEGHRVAAESCSARHFQKSAFFFCNKRIFEFNLQLLLSLTFLPIHTSFVATGGATIGILVLHYFSNINQKHAIATLSRGSRRELSPVQALISNRFEKPVS